MYYKRCSIDAMGFGEVEETGVRQDFGVREDIQ